MEDQRGHLVDCDSSGVNDNDSENNSDIAPKDGESKLSDSDKENIEVDPLDVSHCRPRSSEREKTRIDSVDRTQ